MRARKRNFVDGIIRRIGERKSPLYFIMNERKESFWIDYDAIRRYKMTFNFIIGGRGGGKTYGAIDMLNRYEEKSIWMRRTQVEIDLLQANKGNIALNPFRAYGNDKGIEYDFKKLNKLVSAFGHVVDEKFEFSGYMLALTTVASIRGFNADEIDDLIYDEFIPEMHKSKMKGEAEAFLNAYETVNRNREMEGREPLRCFLLSNSNQLNSPLLNYLKLDDVIEKMKRKKQELYLNPQRSILIYLPHQKSYQQKKAQTAIATLTQGTEFYSMAYENEFAYNDFSNIGGVNLRGYRPVCNIAGIGIWSNDDSGKIYCCLAKAGEREYQDTKADILRFNEEIGRKLYRFYIHNNLQFQNFSIREKIVEIIG